MRQLDYKSQRRLRKPSIGKLEGENENQQGKQRKIGNMYCIDSINPRHKSLSGDLDPPMLSHRSDQGDQHFTCCLSSQSQFPINALF